MLTVDLERFQLHQGDKVLDVGCGEGRHVNNFYFLEAVYSIGVDLSFKDVCTASRRAAELPAAQSATGEQAKLQHMVANAMSLPFATASFDKVICSEVLEHIPDHEAVIKELNRVLKPGGILSVSVPRFWPEKLCWILSSAYHQVEGGHLRIFSATKLKQQISDTGLSFVDRHWAHALHVPYWWLKCLFWSRRDTHFLIRHYHRFLVWDLLQQPKLTRFLEACLNPVMGKSVVLYFKKPE